MVSLLVVTVFAEITIAQVPLVGQRLLPGGILLRFAESTCVKGLLRYIFMGTNAVVKPERRDE
jgi:hypothetical protein